MCCSIKQTKTRVRIFRALFSLHLQMLHFLRQFWKCFKNIEHASETNVIWNDEENYQQNKYYARIMVYFATNDMGDLRKPLTVYSIFIYKDNTVSSEKRYFCCYNLTLFVLGGLFHDESSFGITTDNTRVGGRVGWGGKCFVILSFFRLFSYLLTS